MKSRARGLRQFSTRGLAGIVIAVVVCLFAGYAHSNLVTNGDFEGGWYADATGVPPVDTIPNAWNKLETNMHAGPDMSHLGPGVGSGPGSASLYWDRWNSDAHGDWSTVRQDLEIHIFEHPCLNLEIDVLIFFHNLPGSGFTLEEWEFPATVVVYFEDTAGNDLFWQFGWYQHIDHTPPNGYVLPGGVGIVYSRQISYNVWYYEVFDLVAQLRTLAEPAVITGIMVGGSGWDFIGMADNVAIVPGGPSAVGETTWGGIKSLYR